MTTQTSNGSVGTITQIIGPIVDVHFKDGVPSLLNALTVAKEGGETITLEVAQHACDCDAGHPGSDPWHGGTRHRRCYLSTNW